MKLSTIIGAFTTAKTTKSQPATLEWYGYQFAAFEEWLVAKGHGEDLPLEPETIDAFLAHEMKELKPSSVHGRWRALKALYNWLVDRRKLARDDNPMDSIEEPSVPDTEPRHTVFEEFKQLLDSIPQVSWVDARDRLAITSFFLTGLRVSELVGLKLQDYDTRNSIIRITRQKGGDGNFVPMLPSVSDAFITYIYSRPETNSEYVFVSSDGAGNVRTQIDKEGNTITQVLTRSGMYQRLRDLSEKAAIERINPHAFRHGLAMHLQNIEGAPTSLIQGILRHKDERTTRTRYARWNPSGISLQFDEKMGKVDALLRKRK